MSSLYAWMQSRLRQVSMSATAGGQYSRRSLAYGEEHLSGENSCQAGYAHLRPISWVNSRRF